MTLFINSIGIALILLTLWWFLLSKPRTWTPEPNSAHIDIRVKDGVYEPARIRVPAHRELVLRFLRLDPTPCAAAVVFTRLDRHYLLPLNKPLEIQLDPLPPGELEFTCEMGMYRGRLVIE